MNIGQKNLKSLITWNAKTNVSKKNYMTNIMLQNGKETEMSHEQIVEQYEAYLKEHAAFEEKGVKAAATRARKALGELGKLTKSRRAEIQEKKNAM
jgi:hypothetical protein